MATSTTARQQSSASDRSPAKNNKGNISEEILRACELLAHADVRVAAAAEQVGLNEREFRRIFRELVGTSPLLFQQSARLNRAKEALREVEGTLDAVFAAGYGSVRGLYEAGTQRLGMTPASYARKGKGLVLEVEIAEHELGLLLIAGTPRGVSFVALGDRNEEETLMRELRHDYPLAETCRAETPRWIDAVLHAMDAPGVALDVPLDVYATAFQAKVWEALRRIPVGETRSYSGLAGELGQPEATRAVARACATNRVSVLIPCHRVVGVSGSLTGYRWGKHRKEALLAAERKFVSTRKPDDTADARESSCHQ